MEPIVVGVTLIVMTCVICFTVFRIVSLEHDEDFSYLHNRLVDLEHEIKVLKGDD